MYDAVVEFILQFSRSDRVGYALFVVATMTALGLSLSFLADLTIHRLRREIVRRMH